MISAIAQAVANILASGTHLTGTEQVDFGYPGRLEGAQKSCLNLYLYEIQAVQDPHVRLPAFAQPPSSGEGSLLCWFDVMFALMARDGTALGEQYMISESLTLLLQYPCIPAQFLAPPLKRGDVLPLSVSPITLLSQPTFWNAIGIPIRPALQIVVTTPFKIPAPHQSSLLDRPLNPASP